MNRAKNAVLLSVAALAVSFTSGCATYTVDLKYPGTRTLSAEDTALVRVTDARPNKQVGVGRNFLYIPLAEFVENRPAATWVAEAVVTELQGCGPSGVSVTGVLTRTYCNCYFGYSGSVVVHLEASRNGVSLVSRDYAGEGDAHETMSSSGESNVGMFLQTSLQAALGKFVSDLRAAVPPQGKGP